MQKRYIMGENRDLYKASDNRSEPTKKYDEDAHRLTKAYKLFLIKASNVLK